MTNIQPPDFTPMISETSKLIETTPPTPTKDQAIPFSDIAKSSDTVNVDQVLNLGSETPTVDNNPAILNSYLPISSVFTDITPPSRPAIILVKEVNLPVVGQTTPVTLRLGDNLGKISPVSEGSNQVNTRFGPAEREQLDNGNYGYIFPDRGTSIVTRPDNTVIIIVIPNPTPPSISGSGI